MIRRALYFSLAAILLYPVSVLAQEKKTSRQAVENRLKQVEKNRVSPAIEQAIHALNTASGFAQAAISPDGKKVAWVEELRDKNGAESGNSAILPPPSTPKLPPAKLPPQARHAPNLTSLGHRTAAASHLFLTPSNPVNRSCTSKAHPDSLRSV